MHILFPLLHHLALVRPSKLSYHRQERKTNNALPSPPIDISYLYILRTCQAKASQVQDSCTSKTWGGGTLGPFKPRGDNDVRK